MHTPPQTFTGRLLRDVLSRIDAHYATGDRTFRRETHGKLEQYENDPGEDFEMSASQSRNHKSDPGNDARTPYHNFSGKTDRRSTAIPLKEMLLAARFTQCFETPSQLSALLAPQALSCITIRDNSERRHVWKELPDILQQIVHLAEDMTESRRPVVSDVSTLGTDLKI